MNELSNILYVLLCMRHLVSEADVIPLVHFTDPSRFQQTLIVKAVWDAQVITVSERENTNIYSVFILIEISDFIQTPNSVLYHTV